MRQAWLSAELASVQVAEAALFKQPTLHDSGWIRCGQGSRITESWHVWFSYSVFMLISCVLQAMMGFVLHVLSVLVSTVEYKDSCWSLSGEEA